MILNVSSFYTKRSEDYEEYKKERGQLEGIIKEEKYKTCKDFGEKIRR